MHSTLRSTSTRVTLGHLYGIATLFVPSLLAWSVALSKLHRDELTRAVTMVLGPVCAIIGGAIVVRAINISLFGRRSTDSAVQSIPLIAHLDILTRSGRALAWLSSFAIMGAVWIGWASLAAVGLLGMGVLYLVVLLSLFSLRDPLRGGSITRRFSVATVTEGDDVIEELAITDVHIPVGFRLFISGRIGQRWPLTRHVLDAAESGAEVLLESDVSPAVRGEHDAEPLEMWLEDSFGLCRGPRIEAGHAKICVLPKPQKVDKARPLMERGLGPRKARPVSRIPTEGCFNLREYKQGDDVRRIHWVRSLAAGELIVRLPDEIPPDRPRVRLVLDTFFPEALASSCDASFEMLDRLVATWLGVARALAEQGIHVTLVTATPQPSGGLLAATTKRQVYTLRSSSDALRLGAEVAWQSRVPVAELLTDEATFVVARSVLMLPPSNSKIRWIVVPPVGLSEPRRSFTSGARVPFPMGHPENAWSRRRKLKGKLVEMRRDHERTIRALCVNVAAPPPGSFVARLTDGIIELEAVS